MNENLVSFLNKEENYTTLSKSKINNNVAVDEELSKKISRELILSNNINDDAYEHLIKSIPWYYDYLDVSALSEYRIGILIQSRTIRFSVANIEYLINSKTKKYIDLIESDFDSFFEHQNKLELPEGTITELMISPDTKMQSKYKLITNICDESSYNLFDSEDGLAKAIIDIALKGTVQLPFEIIETLFEFDDNKTKKVKLLTKYSSTLDAEQIYALLDNLGDPYFKIKPVGVFAYLPISDLNLNLIKSLVKSNCVLSHTTTKNKLKIALKRN